MWAVSDAFRVGVVADHTMATEVRASTGHVLGAEDGKIDMDSRRDKTRVGDLTLTPTDELSLAEVYDLVMTPNVELTVYRGLWTASGRELVPLAVLSTDTCPRPGRRTKALSWSGTDRAKKIARARLTDVYPASAGDSLAAWATDLLIDRWPKVAVDLSNVANTFAVGCAIDGGAESDPWAALRTIFEAHGWDLTFDGAGVCRARIIADPSTASPVWDFGAGETNTVVDSEVSGSFEQVYNGVIAVGEGSNVEVPVRAEAWDEDPKSGTNWAEYGRAPYFYSSPLLTTTDMAQRAADTILARVRGRRETLSWSAIVNPALEPLDIVTVAGSRVVLDKLTVPWRASAAMTAAAREMQVA